MSLKNLNKNIIINEPQGVKAMIIPQRSDSYNNIFSSQKSPFVSMINVKEKLGLPPITGKVINHKNLNNNVYKNNIIKPKKRRHQSSLEKYCSLSNDKQFWKKNINPFLETYNEKNKFNMTKQEIKNELEIEEAKGLPQISDWEENNYTCQPKIFNRTSSCQFFNKFNEGENINKLTNQINEKNFQRKQQVTITKLTKTSKKDNQNDNLNSEKEAQNDDNLQKIENNEKNPSADITDNKEVTNIEKEENIDILNDEEDKMDEEEMKDVLGYINSLDYEKYARDMEIREALQLIKNKMEKDQKEKESKANSETIQDNQNEKTQSEAKEENVQINEPNNSQNKKETQPTISEEEQKKKEEIEQFKIAEKIAKDQVIIIYI